MKVRDIQDKLEALILHGGLVGISAEYREAVRSASILIDEVLEIKNKDCKCDGYCGPTCNYECSITKRRMRELINHALKESEIEEDEKE